MEAFFRHEYKYLCSRQELVIERARLFRLLKPDPHTGEEGTYLVRSLYFDDPDASCRREVEDGFDARAKYRLRIYNGSDDYICLERKAKLHGLIHKDSAAVSRELAEELILGRIPDPPDASPMLRRMLTDMRLRVLRPAVIVQYLRTPYILSVGNVRVTLDERIVASPAVSRFFEREIPFRQILSDGQGVLEVKWDELLPEHLIHFLDLGSLRWTSFSKYYLCRQFNLDGGNTK